MSFSTDSTGTLLHQLCVLQFISILTLSTQRQYQIPQVKGSVLQDGPPPPSEASLKSWLSLVLLINLKMGSFSDALLCLINLLEQPTKLRETLYLTRLLVYYKRIELRNSLEKKMVTRSSILAQRILWTEEPGGLPSMGSHRVGHD